MLESLELVGVIVNDLDIAVSRYSDLFGLEFKTFAAGVDYVVAPTFAAPDQPDRALPANGRIALDTAGTFELIEIPGASEGFRNVHFRVDDMDSTVAHMVARGLPVVADLRAGTAREVIFDSRELNGIRLCLLQYDGDSLAAALAASPRP